MAIQISKAFYGSFFGRGFFLQASRNGACTHISVLHQSFYDWVILDWNLFGLHHHIKTNVGAIAEKRANLVCISFFQC